MPYAGDFFIFAAAIMSLISLILYVRVWRGHAELLGLGRKFFVAATAGTTLAISTLLYLILSHNFNVIYVFQYSSTELPWYYLISSLWGGQEGTFLLWIVFVGLLALVMMRTAGKYEVGNMVWINLFVLSVLIILLKKSPFEMMPVFRAEGTSLNPLLQNFWMTIHPPIMFVGFAASVFPFAFAMTGLIDRRHTSWVEDARNWTIFAWLALGVALVMGGYWAYETLGWGGFWAWDPVENASLIPWLFLTAQIHTLFVKRQRGGMMRFALVMVCLSFWSVLYGTFLTRSGVLADFSVHSFVDLGINAFLIIGLLMFIALGIFIIIYRWRDIPRDSNPSDVNSRTFMTALGVIVIFIGGVLVLIGTSFPLLTSWMDNPSSVPRLYYFQSMTPIAIAALLLLALFPAFKWNKGVSRPMLLILAGGGFVLTVGLLLALGVTASALYLLLFGTAVATLLVNGWVLMQSLFVKKKLSVGHLSHVGLAIALIGAAASAGFETKDTVALPMGQTVNEYGYELTFANMVTTDLGFDCEVVVSKDGETFSGILPHEFHRNAEGVMRKPHIRNYLLSDLYLSPLAFEEGDNSTRPGNLHLQKGETRKLDKYEVTFERFETSGHEQQSGNPTAAAILTVTYAGDTVNLSPTLEVSQEDLIPHPVAFDDGIATVSIAGIQPEDGSVMLQLSAPGLPEAEVQPASLVIEVSLKPMIQLFWIGCLIVFASGVVAIVQGNKRRRRSAVAN